MIRSGKIVEGVSADEVFTVLDCGFSKSGTAVYCSLSKIDVDTAIFEFIPDNTANCCLYYSRDKDHVYYHSYRNDSVSRIQGADVKTFKVVYSDKENGLNNNHRYAVDERYVYSKEVKLEGSDSGSFQLLSNDYAKDNNHVYYEGKTLEGADPATFRPLDMTYTIWRDKNHLYRKGKREKKPISQIGRSRI